MLHLTFGFEPLLVLFLLYSRNNEVAGLTPCHLPKIANGIFRYVHSGQHLADQETVLPGSFIGLACYDGFRLSAGSATSICSDSNGNWYTEFGSCLPVCDKPPAISNGRVLDGDSTLGSQRQIICSPGYVISGSSTIICGGPAQLRWSTPGNCTNFFSSVSASPIGKYRFAAVAADAGRCSQIGTAIMAKGGSAVDATVATVICDGVINMHFHGIGGGLFMTVWDNQLQQAFTIDAREVGPISSSEEMFESGNISSVLGPYAIAVPGNVAGLAAAHARFGRLPWKMLIEPTVDLCRRGFPWTKSLQNAVDQVFKDVDESGMNPDLFQEFRKLMTNSDTGRFFKEGEIFRCPKYADTLTRLAEGGVQSFYNGSVAADIIADLQEIGAPLTMTDMMLYKVTWRQPVEMILAKQNLKMFSMRPPGSGAILAFILNILSGYNITPKDSLNPLTYHRFLESLKFAYAKRTFMGDESYVDEMDKFVANLTDPRFGDYIRSMISDTSTLPTSAYAADLFQQPRTNGTTHISIIDGNGNAVAVTSTINTLFGSLMVGRRTGIIFNNEMDDFSTSTLPNSWGLVPSRANSIRPGKRPVSSMCPTIFVKQNVDTGKYDVRLIVGAAGGSKITSGAAYIAMRVLFFGEDVKQAVDASRLHHQLYPETLSYERGPTAPRQLLDILRRQFGHVNQTEDNQALFPFSISQAVERVLLAPENGVNPSQ